jgi:hypothetical protein
VKVGTINALFALTLVAAVLVFPADHSGRRNRESQAANNLEQRIRRVALGLVALDRVKGETPIPKSPIERMHHHKVPGVSIAVINNEKIDWSPGYGLADAATGQTVEIGTRFQAACLWRIVISPSHMACIVTSLFFVLLISQALLIVARHRALPGEFSVLYVGWQL